MVGCVAGNAGEHWIVANAIEEFEVIGDLVRIAGNFDTPPDVDLIENAEEAIYSSPQLAKEIEELLAWRGKVLEKTGDYAGSTDVTGIAQHAEALISRGAQTTQLEKLIEWREQVVTTIDELQAAARRVQIDVLDPVPLVPLVRGR